MDKNKPLGTRPATIVEFSTLSAKLIWRRIDMSTSKNSK